jgi:hypothetical protein
MPDAVASIAAQPRFVTIAIRPLSRAGVGRLYVEFEFR